MAENRSRKLLWLVLLLLVIVALLALWLRGCAKTEKPAEPAAPASTAAPAPSTERSGGALADEILTAATLRAAARVAAGSRFAVEWVGPNNPGDSIEIVNPAPGAKPLGLTRPTSAGTPLELTAPLEPGNYELHYYAGRSRKVLGSAAVAVDPVMATVEAAEAVALGSPCTITWTGPKNAGDFITIVKPSAPDTAYGNYTDTSKGSPLVVVAPAESGTFEIRYVAKGQGSSDKVLARRNLTVQMPEVGVTAPDSAVGGSTVSVGWVGPNNAGDYVTVVPKSAADSVYGNYVNTQKGNPIALLMPVDDVDAEIRYVSGQGRKVLARRPIRLTLPSASLKAAAEAAPGAAVSVEWSGPNYAGDYITIVPRGSADSIHGNYKNTSSGSPVSVATPKQAGEAEIRYVTGQGNKVLARQAIRVAP